VVTVRALRLVPLLLAAAACGPDFPPRSVVFDTRVLAIVAPPLQDGTPAPLELGPADSITLSAFAVGPAGGEVLEESWTFCPFSIGSSVGYQCAVPETPLAESTDPRAYGLSAPITASPGQLALQRLAELAGAGLLPPGAQLPDKVEVLFRYRVTATGGVAREAVQRIPVYRDGAPADPNVAPRLVSVQIGDALWTAGGPPPATLPTLRTRDELDVVASVDPASAQEYFEDRWLTEQLVVSFFTDAGRFDYDRANGPEARVQLRNEETGGAASAHVWVVVRDLRGGQAVGGPYEVLVEP
jgi:hypothetical protein